MGSISNYTPDSLDEVYCDFSTVPAIKRCDSTVTYIMNSSSSFLIILISNTIQPVHDRVFFF